LGTIILLARNVLDDGSGEYAIIDGQQRLITLAILIGVLRDLIEDKEFQRELEECIYQRPKKLQGIPERPRIKIEGEDKSEFFEFFEKYVLKSIGATKTLKEDIGSGKKDKNSLLDPMKRVVDAVDVFYQKLTENNIDLELFARYLLNKTFVVVVKTNAFSLAFKLFTIVNARGVPLTNADILKSINLSVIKDSNERKKYSEIWGNIENSLGVEDLERLISFIRDIKLKEKARKTIFEEFEEKVFKKEQEFKGKAFIDYLNKIANIYREKVLNGSLSLTLQDEKDIRFKNLMSLMRDYLPFDYWIPAFIRFCEKYNNRDKIYEFLVNLERRVVVDWLVGRTRTERQIRIYKIIDLIDNSANPDDVINNEIFNVQEDKDRLKIALDDENFYGKGRGRVPKYVLLRIDMSLRENENVVVEYSGYVTVEHILPRNPKDRYWLDRFDDDARRKWTNRLGNLVLLNRRKNIIASNKPFKEKLEKYLSSGAKESDFAIVNELREYDDWNLENLQKRHRKLIDRAIKIWIENIKLI
jgi:uncharacterized protein with ParB-like and HNH nuclease domain